MINAGIPTIFVNAEDIGYNGTELQDAINGDPKALAMFETIRAHGALRMGLIPDIDEAAKRQHTPKVAFVAKPADYVSSSGKAVAAGDVDLLVRALSMGKLHHAMMGTAAVAIGTAAAIPGTLVNLAAGGGERNAVRFGHPSGTLRVGAEASQVERRMDREQGHHEPQCAGVDGRLGSRAGRFVLTDTQPPVGAGLLAKTDRHSTSMSTIHRFREQARSHKGVHFKTRIASPTETDP